VNLPHLTRRAVLARTVTSAAALTAGSAAWAQTGAPTTVYPGQAIKFIVPFPAGGITDTVGRLLAQKLAEAWKVPVVVENKAGASGTIGNNLVAKSAPDGYTVLVGITAVIQQPAMMANLPYDPFKDLAPVIQPAISTNMLAVPLNSPANTAREFAALVKANPGKHNYGSFGNGTSSHIHGALFNQQAELDMVHVPYPGGAPLLNALLGGQISCGMVDVGTSRPHMKSLKVLAVTGPKRLPNLPDVPTFTELGYQSFDPKGWVGLFVSAGTPVAIVNKLSEELNRILRQPDVIARIESTGLGMGGGTPAEFQAALKADAAIYAKIIQDANIRQNP